MRKNKDLIDLLIERYLLEDSDLILYEGPEDVAGTYEINRLKEEITNLTNMFLNRMRQYASRVEDIVNKLRKYDKEKQTFKQAFSELNIKKGEILNKILKVRKMKNLHEVEVQNLKTQAKEFAAKLNQKFPETYSPEQIRNQEKQLRSQIAAIEKKIADELNIIKNAREGLKSEGSKLKEVHKQILAKKTDLYKQGLDMKALEAQKNEIKEAAKKFAKDMMLKIRAKKELLMKYKTKIITVAAVLAAATAAGAYLYKNYLSSAARSCKDKKGEEKSKCMKRFNIEGLKAKIGVLRSSIKKCELSDDPIVCKEKINDKIKSFENQIDKLSKEL